MPKLQQYLPFTVLKLSSILIKVMLVHLTLQQYLPFTVLKPCNHRITLNATKCVATVLTVYGIETPCKHTDNHCYCQLQQYLPFTVLKQSWLLNIGKEHCSCNSAYRLRYWNFHRRCTTWVIWTVATVLTVCGIENRKYFRKCRHPR